MYSSGISIVVLQLALHLRFLFANFLHKGREQHWVLLLLPVVRPMLLKLAGESGVEVVQCLSLHLSAVFVAAASTLTALGLINSLDKSALRRALFLVAAVCVLLRQLTLFFDRPRIYPIGFLRFVYAAELLCNPRMPRSVPIEYLILATYPFHFWTP